MSRKKLYNSEFFNRSEKVREFYGVNKKLFCKNLGITPSYYSMMASGDRGPGIKILHNLAQNMPDINIAWLLTGTGQMVVYVDSTKIHDVDATYNILRTDPLIDKLSKLPTHKQIALRKLFDSFLELF